MNTSSEENSLLKESLNYRNDVTSDVLIKESSSTCSARSGGTSGGSSNIPRVSLRLPFRSESFTPQSLLAKFHSSRKSESGIKSEVKASSSTPPWAGLLRGGGGQKNLLSVEETQITGDNSSHTSSSLPDDLNHNSDFTCVLSPKSKRTAADDLSSRRDVCVELGDQSCNSTEEEETPFLPSHPQQGIDTWFGTWPGRPRKLKSLKKRLISTSGSNSKGNSKSEKKSDSFEDTQLESPCRTQVPPIVTDEGSDEKSSDSSQHKNSAKGLENVEAEVEMSSKHAKTSSSGHHVSLDTLLESLPLVYDPATRQLCVGSKVKAQNEYLSKRMSNTNLGDDCDSNTTDSENLKGDLYKESLNLFEDEESQKEALLKIAEGCCEISSPAKPLEIIQEDDESGESVRLISKTPQSGSVSGSSSLERGTFESPRNTLQRVNTNNSLSITDASSFSSLSSSNTELSIYSATDSAVCLGSHQSDTSSLRDFAVTDNDGKSKKKGITEFLTRCGMPSTIVISVPQVMEKNTRVDWNLFSWRHKDGSGNTSDGASSTGSSPIPSSPVASTSPGGGWRIFSRPLPRPSRSPDVQLRKSELEAGSAGLIMENRPNNLPAKTAYEHLKHKQEYQQMVSAAKKKEMREAKERKKAQASQQKLEEQLAAAVATWNNDIIPKWDTMHTHKKCRELWWQGLPSCVRGKVWRLAVGNDLNITPQLYSILVQRSVEKLVSLSECGSMASQEDVASEGGDQEGTIDLIRLDVSRTFPHLCIFQKGGPYHDPLHNILGAYACYRPDVGYVQGMSFLAATLLLNMDEADAFISFSNLLNRPAHMAFFRVDQPMMCAYYQAYEELLSANMPVLAEHLRNIEVTPDLYVLDWLLTVFSRPLPLDAAVRIWDVYLRDGEEFLLRAAIGILKLYEGVLSNQECTATAAQFLTRLPDDLCADALFRAIASVRTSAHKRTFSQILQAHMDAVVNSSV